MGAIDFLIVNPSTLEHVPPEGGVRGAGGAQKKSVVDQPDKLLLS